MYEAVSEALRTLLGLGREAGEIGIGQMALRAVVVYGFTLLIVRSGSQRFLGKATAFDVIVGIMIGSVMSRGINGSAAFAATLVAGGVLIALHWMFAAIAYHTRWFGSIVKGKPVKLIEDGRILEDAMRGSNLSSNDLVEALRVKGMYPDPSQVAIAHLERDGTISVIPQRKSPRLVDVQVADGVQTVRLELG